MSGVTFHFSKFFLNIPPFFSFLCKKCIKVYFDQCLYCPNTGFPETDPLRLALKLEPPTPAPCSS